MVPVTQLPIACATRAILAACCLALAAGAAPASQQKRSPAPVKAMARDGEAEARLIEVYKLIGQARHRDALQRAEKLVREHPNFQLAQLVYGDLLTAQARPVRAMGDVPEAAAKQGMQMLADLREEAQLRIRALRERPPEGAVPAAFLQLPPTTRHALAVDTSRARLYLFENTPSGLKVVADYYVSVGKAGWEKAAEGDMRTPLGVYFITSNLDPKKLRDFYGAGALPINYPNQYDARRGKTGSGIWLHGTPPSQFARAPKATDGCLVLANPDLLRLIRTVEIRSTPVVISNNLKWVSAEAAKAEGRQFNDVLQSWRAAKASGDMVRLLGFYTPDFSVYGKTLAEWTPGLRAELDRAAGRGVELKDVSMLRWTDSADTMVVTFGELAGGARNGTVKRQYWVRQGAQWKIFFEGVIG